MTIKGERLCEQLSSLAGECSNEVRGGRSARGGRAGSGCGGSPGLTSGVLPAPSLTKRGSRGLSCLRSRPRGVLPGYLTPLLPPYWGPRPGPSPSRPPRAPLRPVALSLPPSLRLLRSCRCPAPSRSRGRNPAALLRRCPCLPEIKARIP